MIFFIAVALISFVIIVLIQRDWRNFSRMPALDPSAKPVASSTVTIVIPARNEALNIARCLEGALSQTYSQVDVVVVDDASTDDTPRILAEMQARHSPKLRVVQGRPLPQGWVGKCNACLHGASFAGGDWLLFLDADTAPQPALVSGLLAFAQQRDLSVVTTFPLNELPTFSEWLMLPAFIHFILTVFPLPALLTMAPPANQALANGQCLLIKRHVYESVGGHEAVKDKVLEDVEFAQALRRAGHRIGLATAFDQLRVRMYRNFGEIVQGLGKHASAGIQAGGSRAFYAVARLSLTMLWPPLLSLACVLVLLMGLDSGWGLPALLAAVAVNVASIGFWARRYRDWYHLQAWKSLLAPIGLMLYFLIAARSIVLSKTRRGVAWKGRVYS